MKKILQLIRWKQVNTELLDTIKTKFNNTQAALKVINDVSLLSNSDFNLMNVNIASMALPNLLSSVNMNAFDNFEIKNNKIFYSNIEKNGISKVFSSSNKTYPDEINKIKNFFNCEPKNIIIYEEIFSTLYLSIMINYNTPLDMVLSKEGITMVENFLQEKKKILTKTKFKKRGFAMVNCLLTNEEVNELVSKNFTSTGKCMDFLEKERSAEMAMYKTAVLEMKTQRTKLKYLQSDLNNYATSVNQKVQEINKLKQKLLTAQSGAPRPPAPAASQDLVRWS